MTRKNLTIAAALIAIVAILAVGTVAYFTDTDSAENTFTIGNVDIKLIEQQRGENGLEDFDQNKVLLPLVGSETAGYDDNNMPTAGNYGDKIVTVENTGASDAWVRCYFAIPTALDAETASDNVLHFNFGTDSENKKTNDAGTGDWLWKTNGTWNTMECTIDGTAYTVYFADYATTLAAGDTTARFLNGVYLDSKVDIVTVNGVKFLGINGASSGFAVGNIKCPVAAVAVQAAGFDSAAAAVAAAFPANFNPFTAA